MIDQFNPVIKLIDQFNPVTAIRINSSNPLGGGSPYPRGSGRLARPRRRPAGRHLRVPGAFAGEAPSARAPGPTTRRRRGRRPVSAPLPSRRPPYWPAGPNNLQNTRMGPQHPSTDSDSAPWVGCVSDRSWGRRRRRVMMGRLARRAGPVLIPHGLRGSQHARNCGRVKGGRRALAGFEL